uniref:Uncharacterized protein n=1 Tax=Anguilla anguilla TaxID=7936 RepID=A0A0E9XUC9_ANGAN
MTSCTFFLRESLTRERHPFWYTLSASCMAPFPQSRVCLIQHESGTDVPSGLKLVQSAEEFTPQHFRSFCISSTAFLNSAELLVYLLTISLRSESTISFSLPR